ncbi:MAG: hypothetical protein KJ879_00565 [Nanoarchaeota archaeon]|nr:hypothetical protein [Nanoarchaeota archaeon]
MKTQVKPNKKQEYIHINEIIRHYHNQRFAQLTLWLAITAVLLSVLFGKTYNVTPIAAISLKLIGIIASIVFWVMDQRMVDHWRYFWQRAKQLESDLGFQMWQYRPKRTLLGSTNATRLLYGAVTVFWLFTLFFPSFF